MSVYKRQIYQIAESNRIEKIDSVARIESKLFRSNWDALPCTKFEVSSFSCCGDFTRGVKF